jgi:acetyl-CoA acetyltransferase
MPVKAVICVPNTDRGRWEAECLAHCTAWGYDVVAVMTAGDGAVRDICQMVASGEIDVIVVARFEHLPQDTLPRIEEATGSKSVPGQRRPRTVRWIRD